MNVRLIGGGIKVVIRRLDLGSEGKAGIRNDSQVSCLNNWVLCGSLYKNDGSLGKKKKNRHQERESRYKFVYIMLQKSKRYKW